MTPVQLQELLALNEKLPPLFCAPVLVKDNFDTLGMAATAGAVGLLDNLAAENAFVVSSSFLEPPKISVSNIIITRFSCQKQGASGDKLQ